MDDISIYKCMVAGYNSDGEPDFFVIKLRCTEAQINNGTHYVAASDEARESDFDPRFTFDNFDEAGERIQHIFDWDDSLIVDIVTNDLYEGYAAEDLELPRAATPDDPLADALDAVVADASRSNYDLSRLAV